MLQFCTTLSLHFSKLYLSKLYQRASWNLPCYTLENHMENFLDWFAFLLPAQHCSVDSVHASVRARQYEPVDEIWVFEMYVFGNHIYHKQIVCLAYMLQNDLKNENNMAFKIRVISNVEGQNEWRRTVLTKHFPENGRSIQKFIVGLTFSVLMPRSRIGVEKVYVTFVTDEKFTWVFSFVTHQLEFREKCGTTVALVMWFSFMSGKFFSSWKNLQAAADLAHVFWWFLFCGMMIVIMHGQLSFRRFLKGLWRLYLRTYPI